VNFRLLAGTYEASGGDIRNAVLKAAMAAASEPGRDAAKQIHQRHLEQGITEVLAAKHVMRQSLFQTDVTTIDQATTRAIDALHRGAWLPLVIGTIALVLSILALIATFTR
jgi:hypothetical protein